jgi:hypothetical protein
MYVHRFKCNSKELSDSIKYFSEIHKNDDKEHLIHYFEKWKHENEDLINNEKEYLLRHHYEYDIYEKIFKSIKYYYIKKYNKPNHKNLKKGNQEFRTPKNILQEIKSHLNDCFNANPFFKPSISYLDFEEKYKYNHKNIKKAYKNQYYQIKLNKVY